MPTPAEDIATVRDLLTYFINRADGCPDKNCFVGRRHVEHAERARAALGRIESIVATEVPNG